MRKEVLGMKAPEKPCLDSKCPFHGKIEVRKELQKGVVIKKDVNHSATISWERPFYVPKYERYEVRRSKMRVHNPPCLDAPLGSVVVAAKTRPLSKTKNHVIISVKEEQHLDVVEKMSVHKADSKKVKEDQEDKEKKSKKEHESS